MKLIIRRNPDAMFSVVDEETIILDIKAGNYFSLDNTGSYIWEALEQPHTIEQLIDKLLIEFDVSENTCRKEVNIFINELLDRNLISQESI